MSKLKISKKTAIKLHPEAPEWFQKVLTETFGEETFKPRSWRDIKTFDDACKAKGTTEAEFNANFEGLGLSIDTIAYEKVKIIVAAINEEWVPDWSDEDQYKYYPAFVLASGSGFSGRDYAYRCSSSSVGSRLCFESKEKCLYAAEQFSDIYEDFFIINN